MSLICNTGRPPKDDALQNLTINDTLRVNNLIKSTKAEIDRLCPPNQNVPIVLGGSMYYNPEGSAAIDLKTFPSGLTEHFTSTNSPSVSNFWYTPEDLTVSKFQVAAYANSAVILDVSISTTSDPLSPPVDLLTVQLALNGTNNSIQSDDSGSVVIPAGSYVTIRNVTSTSGPNEIYVSWILMMNP